MRRLALIAAMILLTASQARAEVPGDACTGAQANQFGLSSLNPNTGFENGLFCDGSTWKSVINFEATGNVGIGTIAPAAPLHVNGEAILGMKALACSATTEGALRYNSSTHLPQFCDGTNWQYITASGPSTVPGCGGHTASLSTQQITTIAVTGGCTVTFKVWGAGGVTSCTAGGGGGYSTITLTPGTTTTYYLAVGGTNAAGLTGYTGGNTPGDAFGGSASGVWTGSYGGTPVLVSGGGGSGWCVCCASGYPGGLGAQTTGTAGACGTEGSCGGGGYPTGGAGGTSSTVYGSGGSNYAASGGTTANGSGSSPGNLGDVNLPTNAGSTDHDGAIYYSW